MNCILNVTKFIFFISFGLSSLHVLSMNQSNDLLNYESNTWDARHAAMVKHHKFDDPQRAHSLILANQKDARNARFWAGAHAFISGAIFIGVTKSTYALCKENPLLITSFFIPPIPFLYAGILGSSLYYFHQSSKKFFSLSYKLSNISDVANQWPQSQK